MATYYISPILLFEQINVHKLTRFIEFLNEQRFGNSLLSDLRLHMTKRQNGGSTKLLGKDTYYIDGRNFITCRREIFRDESYKIPLPKTHRKPVIVDCGANIGIGVIYLKYLIPNSHIIAFEPDPKNFLCLKNNIASHALSDVQAIESAVWIDANGISFLPSGNMESRIANGSEEHLTQVTTARLRDILLKFEFIHFLKIDIEGAEVEVLKDCKDLLSRCEYMFIEYHSISQVSQELNRLLSIISDNGFRYHMKEAHSSSLPYSDDYSEGAMEFQVNIFCYKIL